MRTASAWPPPTPAAQSPQEKPMTTMRMVCISLAFAAAARADEPTKSEPTKTKPTGKMAMTEPVFVNAKELKWAAAPPDLPKGLQMAVLYGDPTKSGPF